jgi:hypothetical protein
MDANELRALQAPLKKQYREQPETPPGIRIFCSGIFEFCHTRHSCS